MTCYLRGLILCRTHRWARIHWALSPHDHELTVSMERSVQAIREHIIETGEPLVDLENLTEFTLDRWGDVQESPLADGRFSDWLKCGADSVAPGFRRTA